MPGTDGPVTTPEGCVEFVETVGLPVIIKAAMGGGGKGMRVVREMDDLIPFFESASSEAKASFGVSAQPSAACVKCLSPLQCRRRGRRPPPSAVECCLGAMLPCCHDAMMP